MHCKVTTDEAIILRDGRPFGNAGVFGGNSLSWPLPQTLSGMIRTSVGFSRDPDYFDSEENCQKILDVSLNRILPLAKLNNGWEPCFPLPADLVFTGGEKHQETEQPVFQVNQLSYAPLSSGSGTDIPNRQWLIPSVDLREKPSKETPFFCSWDFFDQYLKEEVDRERFLFSETGVDVPVRELRLHNGIRPDTFTTEEGKLFCNHGIYFRTFQRGTRLNQEIPLAIAFDINGASDDRMDSTAFLGAERKRVAIEKCENYFPRFPSIFSGKRFLKIVLTTHGDFQAWAPQWLMPDLRQDDIQWVTIPGTTFQVRLRSAVVTGWDGISGWDYRRTPSHPKGQPKAMKKLVRPGSVFIIEIKNRAESEEIARLFWGGTLENGDTVNNGYNQTIVGNCSVKTN